MTTSCSASPWIRSRLMFIILAGTLSLITAACRTPDGLPLEGAPSMDDLARQYVVLVLATGAHDADFVDAYYGPEELRAEAKAGNWDLEALASRVSTLIERLGEAEEPVVPIERQRLRYLRAQSAAMLTRIRILQGQKLSFDQESLALYGAVSPHHPESHYQALIQSLDRELPGEGPLGERLESFRRDFVIPPDRLDTVFRTATEGCRERTLRHIELPADESFTIEYVTDKAWSGYNWYQGGFRSLIQVNTDLPIYIDRAVDLACHEGYPGHHAYNVLLEKNLVRDRGWVEFTVYALFSPQSLIAEGSANYGIEVAFPADERARFEREVLFPLAGLNPTTAERYYRIQGLTSQLSYAGNEAARMYLDGEMTAEQAADWQVRYALMSPERARQRIQFIDKYRTYVINYNLGKDLVRQHVEAMGGTADNSARRWEIFEEMLSTPTLPGDLRR